MASEALGKEFKYYLDNQNEFVKQYDGKYIVLKNQIVLGAYDSEVEAYEESSKDNEIGTFLIQFVSAGEDNHTQVFHTRVAV